MEKENYIAKLFNDIKDNIEFDSDIIAIITLLTKMLDYDVKQSFFNWKYVVQKYDIPKLMTDIDFEPLLKDYPIRLLEKVGYSSFFEYIKTIPKTIQNLIYSYLFNVFSKSFLYDIILSFIHNKKIKEEKKFVIFILKQSSFFPKDIFDTMEFLKKTIFLHIKEKYIPIKILLEFTEYPTNKKEQAVLKSLLIDYQFKKG